MDHLIIEHQIERRRKRRRGIIALLAALAALTLGAGSFSLAQFTDSDTSTWSFTAGSIDIVTDPTVGANVTGMMPGDVVTEDLNVTNNGVEDFRYSMTTTASTALGTELQLEVRSEDVDGGCDDFDGAAARTVTPVQTLNGAGFGSNAQGQDTDDRFLAGGASEVLCFRVSLPLTANTNVQGLTSAVLFTFDAEQTVNNP
jgi:hypothetical protein